MVAKNTANEEALGAEVGAAAVETREPEALKLVKGYIGWASGSALIPVPMADIAAITATQIRMLQKLGELYGIPFHENLAKTAIAGLVGTATPMVAAAPVASLVKLIPVVGPLASAVTMPALAGASTWALGKVFIQHFESGGTFLDFNPSKVSKYFEEQYSAKAKAKSAGTA